MAFTFFICIAYTMLALLIFYSILEPERTGAKKNGLTGVAVLFSAAFIVRLIMAYIYPGHETDMNCFSAWAGMLTDGFSDFYKSESFTDYPPGYMYILYPIGVIKNSFNLNTSTTYILLKLPSIICDLLSAAIIYKIACNRLKNNLSLTIAGLYLFNPVIILNSSIWGQVDSVYTVFVLLTIYMLWIKKLKQAYFLYAIAIFIKPQALFYAPVLIFAVIEQVFMTDFSRKKFFENFSAALGAIAMVFILALPFGIREVLEQYKNTIASYDFASVNAYNFWTAINYNWSELTPLISFLGYLFIIIIVCTAAMNFFKYRSETKYFYTSAFVCFSTFMMSVKMHDRYAYPVIALMLCTYVLSKRKEDMFLYIGISAVQLINSAHALFYYSHDTYFSSGYRTAAVAYSWLSLAVFAYFIICFIKQNKNTSNIKVTEELKVKTKTTRKDIIAIVIITVIYSAIALFNLGDFSAPQSVQKLEPDTPASIDLGKDTNISSMKLNIALPELSDKHTLTITICNAAGETQYINELNKGSVFWWGEINDVNITGRYIILQSNVEMYINELAAYDNSMMIVPATSSPLVDEQELVPEFTSYKNSTYFDEIYHARTGYEFVNGHNIYEWTHPPLGKIFIALGIKLFGMTPFGWRIVGTLFGIFMLPFMYIFAKKLFGHTWLSVCTTLLFAFDFMHFTQTRISTIDVYVTFFIILMYLFMYKFYTMDYYNTPLSKTFVPIALSGLSMSFAIACKWTGVYAGAGLALIFFISLYHKYKENKAEFSKRIGKTIGFCLIMFVAVPLIVYVLSYIPYMTVSGCGINGVIQNQIDMFTYHGKTVLTSTHPYSSPWYQWPIVARPIWYYTGTNGELSENISAFGNPFVWWLGIAAFIYCVYDCIKNRSRTALFLVIAYLAQLLPWILVTRITFIYHYFPSVPFIVMMIGYWFYNIYSKTPKFKKYVIIYTVICVLAFVVFYPVISGFPFDAEYAKTFLKWLPGWMLVR